MRRREFLGLIRGAAAVWPMTAGAQQTTMPTIGYLDARSIESVVDRLSGFRQGLKESGYVDGENVAILYRSAENQLDRLEDLATDLVRRNVAVIAAAGAPAAFAAKRATTRIPIVLLIAAGTPSLGLSGILPRPDGNVTGINIFNAELAAKRLELLRELVPRTGRVAVLVNRADLELTEIQLKDVEAATRTVGLQTKVFNADSNAEIDAAFEAINREQSDAVLVTTSPFFYGRRVQLAQLAAFHRIPAVYALRDYAEAGGLMSYGSDVVDAYRQVGIYTGRLLRGAKPAELQFVQQSKFELIINAQTARMLRLTLPVTLLARADDVIE
jgi:putative tryptophan/tyrosine transport system substrate-binding protein